MLKKTYLCDSFSACPGSGSSIWRYNDVAEMAEIATISTVFPPSLMPLPGISPGPKVKWCNPPNPMHYGLSPEGNRELRKTYLGFHFLAIHIFQTEIFEISFTFVLYLGTSLNPSQQQLNFHENQLQFKEAVERMWEKYGDQLNVALKTDCKYFLTI